MKLGDKILIDTTGKIFSTTRIVINNDRLNINPHIVNGIYEGTVIEIFPNGHMLVEVKINEFDTNSYWINKGDPMKTLKKDDKVMVDVTGILRIGSNGPVVSIHPGGRIPDFSPPVVTGINKARVVDISIVPPEISVSILKDGYENYYVVSADRIKDVLEADIE